MLKIIFFIKRGGGGSNIVPYLESDEKCTKFVSSRSLIGGFYPSFPEVGFLPQFKVKSVNWAK